jgi:hypothetical protein
VGLDPPSPLLVKSVNNDELPSVVIEQGSSTVTNMAGTKTVEKPEKHYGVALLTGK